MIDKAKLRRIVRSGKGKTRVFYTYPNDDSDIKKQHEVSVAFLNERFIPSIFSHAYTKKRSIYTNAKPHLLNDVFIKFDVKNFFPSLNHQFLIDEMYFELNKKDLNSISLNECRELVENSSVHSRGLPLGLITSPILSNIYMKKFDSLLYGRLKKLNLQSISYTRYADDIFISFGDSDLSELLDDLFERIRTICIEELARCHLVMNSKKTKFIKLSKSNHVKIAGINIVRVEGDLRRLTISRKTVKNLYFSAISLHARQGSESQNGGYSTEINRVKGLHSFVLSIEKKGYSHVLSSRMKANIESMGYASLEDLISKLKV